jgi:hypothetical protein
MPQTPSFEEIDRHINALDLREFQADGRFHFTTTDVKAAPGDVLQKVCTIYRAIRPILLVLQGLPLIPAAWRAAIKTFTGLMDTLCP